MLRCVSRCRSALLFTFVTVTAGELAAAAIALNALGLFDCHGTISDKTIKSSIRERGSGIPPVGTDI
jgi:hypothetical protein